MGVAGGKPLAKTCRASSGSCCCCTYGSRGTTVDSSLVNFTGWLNTLVCGKTRLLTCTWLHDLIERLICYFVLHSRYITSLDYSINIQTWSLSLKTFKFSGTYVYPRIAGILFTTRFHPLGRTLAFTRQMLLPLPTFPCL